MAESDSVLLSRRVVEDLKCTLAEIERLALVAQRFCGVRAITEIENRAANELARLEALTK